ncbi:hypothetical protein HOLleu_07353 [Holothuria leucospilota]|uniref:Uncharacterized protein n=1 Tax=Holothuria leucospilota TaxID=206669 RepID=A0A9Q1CH28_HOLLE|nr:hypothetical protein HOLleu_07353 [Holothuria leucospilota]
MAVDEAGNDVIHHERSVITSPNEKIVSVKEVALLATEVPRTGCTNDAFVSESENHNARLESFKEGRCQSHGTSIEGGVPYHRPFYHHHFTSKTPYL